MTLKEYFEELSLPLREMHGPRETDNIIKSLKLDLDFLDELTYAQPLNDKLLEELAKVKEQLLEGKPLQQITQKAHFYGFQFYVNEHVLIPRPETEELVLQILESNQLVKPKIIDIGTGSGCIPVALKFKLPSADLTAIDISKEALMVAQSNAGDLDEFIDFKQVDFLDESSWTQFEKFDIIVSNPPYIHRKEKEEMGQAVIDYEPHLALFVDDDPLIFYRKILSFSKDHLEDRGMIFLELNEFRANETEALFEPFYQTVIIKDLQGKDRILKCEPKAID